MPNSIGDDIVVQPSVIGSFIQVAVGDKNNAPADARSAAEDRVAMLETAQQKLALLQAQVDQLNGGSPRGNHTLRFTGNSFSIDWNLRTPGISYEMKIYNSGLETDRGGFIPFPNTGGPAGEPEWSASVLRTVVADSKKFDLNVTADVYIGQNTGAVVGFNEVVIVSGSAPLGDTTSVSRVTALADRPTGYFISGIRGKSFSLTGEYAIYGRRGNIYSSSGTWTPALSLGYTAGAAIDVGTPNRFGQVNFARSTAVPTLYSQYALGYVDFYVVVV